MVTTSSKRQREVDDSPTVESDSDAVTTKKMKTGKDSKGPVPQAPPRRSGRAHATTPTTPAKRKRRTKEQIAADKAKADKEKKRLEELSRENHRTMVQMDLVEDMDRAGTAARTIRTLKNIQEESGEEFVGYADVVDSESEDEAEDALTLKVSGTNVKG
jgi:hypothetical protein